MRDRLRAALGRLRIDRSSLALIWGATIYASSASANALVSFFLVPFLTYYLSPADYGTVETFAAASAGLTSLVIVGGNTMLAKEHFALTTQELSTLTSEIIGAVLFVASLLLITVSVLTALGAIGTKLGLSGTILGLAVIVSVGNALTNLLVTGYQLSKRPGLYAAFMNSRTAVELALSLVLVGALGLAWQGRVAGIVATSLLSIVVVTWAFWYRGIRFSVPRKYRHYIVAAAPALVIANLTGWTNDMSDRFIVAGMVDLHATGLYSIAYRFGMVISVLETAFARAWQPFFYENIQRLSHEANLKIVKASYIYILGLCGVTAIYSLAGPTLLRAMVSEEYVEAAAMVPIVSAGYCCAGIWKMFTGYLINAGQNTIYAATLAVTALLNVVLSIVFVREFGYIGAAWGTLIAFAAGAVLTAVLAQRACPMPWLLRPRT